MDIARSLSGSGPNAISTIEMHTTAEPVRIIYSGYPELTGTLIEQRRQAKLHHDAIRRRLMLEPRGHNEMYGAILRPTTELVSAGQAHIGVLFCHGEGYSTMCGHATIALGRFLVDTHDLAIFPRRDMLTFDSESRTIKVLLHAPCGVVEVIVPVLGPGGASESSRPVSFLSVPSFATALSLPVFIPSSRRWPEMGSRSTLNVDISYGGAFYALVSASELGFTSGLRTQRGNFNIEAMSRATAVLKEIIMTTPSLKQKVVHPEHEDLSYLYSVMLVDDGLGVPAPGTNGVETGLCFFADQQLDRSPTGSCVAARIALACARNILRKGDAWTYHSLVSNAFGSEGGFVGRVEAFAPINTDHDGIIVRTEGRAWYTGSSSFIVETDDVIGTCDFSLRELTSGKS